MKMRKSNEIWRRQCCRKLVWFSSTSSTKIIYFNPLMIIFTLATSTVMSTIQATSLYTNQLDWVDWFESTRFSAKLIGLIQFLFQVNWMVIESIRFHEVVDWVDWLWATGMIESVQSFQKILKRSTEMKVFQKKSRTKSKVFQEKVNNILIAWFD